MNECVIFTLMRYRILIIHKGTNNITVLVDLGRNKPKHFLHWKSHLCRYYTCNPVNIMNIYVQDDTLNSQQSRGVKQAKTCKYYWIVIFKNTFDKCVGALYLNRFFLFWLFNTRPAFGFPYFTQLVDLMQWRKILERHE